MEKSLSEYTQVALGYYESKLSPMVLPVYMKHADNKYSYRVNYPIKKDIGIDLSEPYTFGDKIKDGGIIVSEDVYRLLTEKYNYFLLCDPGYERTNLKFSPSYYDFSIPINVKHDADNSYHYKIREKHLISNLDKPLEVGNEVIKDGQLCGYVI